VSPSRTRTLRRTVVLAVGVVAADQAVKAVVRTTIDLGERREVLPFLDLVHVRNTGVAFGFLAGGGALLIAGTGVALVALTAYVLSHSDRPFVWVPAGLVLGGAAGNLLDRLREGYVTDFVKLPHWPAFNVADIAITLGVVALIYVLERAPRRRQAERHAAPAADGG
jgi:signal peptidase II